MTAATAVQAISASSGITLQWRNIAADAQLSRGAESTLRGNGGGKALLHASHLIKPCKLCYIEYAHLIASQALHHMCQRSMWWLMSGALMPGSAAP